jgi:DNA-directed RNA polymerase subunit K/omega
MAQTPDSPPPAETTSGEVDVAPLLTSRFLFVDVAAQRAKQLRRGALPRLERAAQPGTAPHKLERVAMEEVRTGLIEYVLPQGFDGPAHGDHR